MPLLPREKTRNLDFSIADNADGTWSRDAIQCVVLMDIRDELQKLNAVFACANFQSIPRTLRTISRKLPVRRRKVAKA